MARSMTEVVEEDGGGLLGYYPGELEAVVEEIEELGRELKRLDRNIRLDVSRPGPRRVVVRVYVRRGIGALSAPEYEEHLRASLNAVYAGPPAFALSTEEYTGLRDKFTEGERDEWVRLERRRRNESPALVREFRRRSGRSRLEYGLPIWSARQWVLGS